MKPPISLPRQVAVEEDLGMLAICMRNLIDPTRPGADIAGDPGVIRRVRGRKPAGKR